MSNSANKVILVVAAAAVLVLVALVVGSGSCSAAGSGGGAAGSGAAGGTAASASSAAGAQASDGWNENASYEDLRDQLLEELAEGTAPVGSDSRDAASASDVMSVSEAHAELASRGFGDVVLSANFDMQGAYVHATELDPASPERYPSYQASWQSGANTEWRLVVNGARLFAVPVSAADGAIGKEVIFSEADDVVQYDGTRNLYSSFGFGELGDAVGVKVDRIDAATLDAYTAATLNGMA